MRAVISSLRSGSRNSVTVMPRSCARYCSEESDAAFGAVSTMRLLERPCQRPAMSGCSMARKLRVDVRDLCGLVAAAELCVDDEVQLVPVSRGSGLCREVGVDVSG